MCKCWFSHFSVIIKSISLKPVQICNQVLQAFCKQKKLCPRCWFIPSCSFIWFLRIMSKNQFCLETLPQKKVWVANIVQLLGSSIVKMLHAHQNYCIAVRSSGLVRFTSITHFFILWRTQSVCLPGQARPKLDQQPT